MKFIKQQEGAKAYAAVIELGDKHCTLSPQQLFAAVLREFNKIPSVEVAQQLCGSIAMRRNEQGSLFARVLVDKASLVLQGEHCGQ